MYSSCLCGHWPALPAVLYCLPGDTCNHYTWMPSHPSVKSLVLYKCTAPVYMATALLCLLYCTVCLGIPVFTMPRCLGANHLLNLWSCTSVQLLSIWPLPCSACYTVLYCVPGDTCIHDAWMPSHQSVKSLVLYKCTAPVYMVTALLYLLYCTHMPGETCIHDA